MKSIMNFNFKKGFIKGICGVLLSLYMCGPIAYAGTQTEEEKIISVVNQFFEVLSSLDVNVAKQIMMPEGTYFSIRKKGEGFLIKNSTFQKYIEDIPNIKVKLKETMTNPKVLIHDRIAVLWTRYDFFVNGKFSHCGVDAFNLIKTPDGWKIAGCIYSVEKTGCNQ